MRIPPLFSLALALLLIGGACSDDATAPPPDSGRPDLAEAGAPDAAVDAASDAAITDGPKDGAGTPDALTTLPRLGVFIVKVDGSGLQLLVDAGSHQLTHVRPGPSGWLTATRYNEDTDGNGLAMEDEGGGAPHYGKTEVVVFRRDAPQAVTVIAGGTPDRLCANSSFTADSKLLFLHQDDPTTPGRSRFKRVTFATLPTVSTIDVVDVPPELFPVDPYQSGLSDASGKIVFPAVFLHAQGWMRPVWQMPASGTKAMTGVQLVGCPLCPKNAGCCAFPTPAEVLGTNDPTWHPQGTQVLWMQQHPDVSFPFGAGQVYPYRQVAGEAGKPQVDLTQPGTPVTTVQSYVQWRPDGAEVVYWEIQIDLAQGITKQPLFRMKPDGSGRTAIPLPADLCTSHPSYLDSDTIIFSGWRCGGTPCSCAADKL